MFIILISYSSLVDACIISTNLKQTASFSGHPIGCLNFVVCFVIDGFSMDRIWANCACDIRKYWKNRSSKLCNSRTSVWNSPRWALVCSVSCTQTRRWRLFCRLCRRLNTNKSNKRSRISRRLLYAAIIDDALRWLRQRDKAANSFAYRSLFTASLSPNVNATAGGKISRRAIYRRNNA